jgi:hypothetical protein
MAFAVMSEATPCRTVLAAHLPSLTLPEFIFFKAFSFSYEQLPIFLTNEARRKFTLHKIAMTSVIPTVLEKHIDLAVRLARDNHPLIRVLKECDLHHKEMLFATPVVYKPDNLIVGVLLAYDTVSDDLCPSPGHLINQDTKSGFLTSVFKHNNSGLSKRGWSLNARSSLPDSPNCSEKTMEMIEV